MTGLEVIRAVWTLGTGIGTALMFGLLREALVDNWAVRARRPNAMLTQASARGDVWDQFWLTVAMLALFLAGAISYSGQSLGTITLLITCAVALVVKGVIKHRRRRRLLRALRLLPSKEG